MPVERRFLGPALVVGFGLGAMLDGIVLHQVLQWHHLVVGFRSADTLDGLEHNTFWDGVFHLVAWAVVVVGVLWLWSRRGDARRLGLRSLVGSLLVGWGTFNVVDQIVFHLTLDAHHIRMVESYWIYDWGYTALGILLVVLGWVIAGTRRRRGLR